MASASALIFRQNIRRQATFTFSPAMRRSLQACEKHANRQSIDRWRYNSFSSTLLNTNDPSIPKPTGPSHSPTPYTQKTETVTSSQDEPLGHSNHRQEAWSILSRSLEETSIRTSKWARAGKLSAEEAWRRRSASIQDTIKNSWQGYSSTTSGENLWSSYDRIGTGTSDVPTVSSGRTVTSSDFAAAVRRLDIILARNKVKNEWRRDKYFEKPSAKRYRLRSQRHRRRFAAMIREKVKIVQAIRRRGM